MVPSSGRSMPVWTKPMLIVVLLAAAALFTSSSMAARDIHPADRPPGVLFGAYVQPQAGPCSAPTPGAAIAAFQAEGCLGRSIDIVRRYYRWDSPFPTEEISDCRAARIPHVSFKPLTAGGRAIRWSAIASGAQDEAIDRIAAGIRRIRSASPACTMWVTFDHEADLDVNGGFSGTDLGGAGQFVAAWRHFFARLRFDRAEGPSVRRVFVLDHWAYPPKALDPGAGEVDAYGVDAFDRPFCTPERWRSLASLTSAAVAYARARGTPLYITEAGAVGDPSDPPRRARWIAAAGVWIAAHPTVRAVAYWNGQDGGCDYRLNADPAAMAALSAMAVGEPLG
jgi:hypothetical protein